MNVDIDGGIAWLDRVAPGWRLSINPETLNMRAWKTCILGQVFHGVANIILPPDLERMGFASQTNHEELKQLWLSKIYQGYKP